MKRLIAATLALTLMGSTAAMARGWHGYHHHGHDGAGAALALGLGIATLGIIAAANSHDRYYDRDYGYYAPPPPPPGYYRYRGYYGPGYYDRGYYGPGYYGPGYYDDDDD